MPLSKPATTAMARPRVPRVPSRATAGTARRGTAKHKRPAARGSQSNTWIIEASPSMGCDQEVEAERGEAPDQEQRIRAHEAGLGPPHHHAHPADEVDG